jgi:hypothetical protein
MSSKYHLHTFNNDFYLILVLTFAWRCKQKGSSLRPQINSVSVMVMTAVRCLLVLVRRMDHPAG